MRKLEGKELPKVKKAIAKAIQQGKDDKTIGAEISKELEVVRTPDSMTLLAAEVRSQLALTNEANKFSWPKFTSMIVNENALTKYKGLLWSKQGYKLIQIDDEQLSILAVRKLKQYGLEDVWNDRGLKMLWAFLPEAINIEIVEPPKWALFCSNAVVDLRTGKEITPHQEWAVIHLNGAKFDPAAKSVHLKAGFEKAFSPILQEAFLSIFGARLTLTTEDSSKLKTRVLLHGDGNQSKGTWKDVIIKIFGGRVCQEPIEYMTYQFRSKVFIGCDIIWNAETQTSYKNELLIKRITGGTNIGVETKGREKYSNEAVQAIYCEDTNSPSPPAMGDADITRMEWFKLTGHFVREQELAKHKDDPTYFLMDPDFEAKAFTEQELSGFLNMLLPYARYYLEHNDYKQHASKDMEALTTAASSIDAFVDNFISFEVDAKDRLQTIEGCYKKYCKKAGNEVKPWNMVVKILTKYGAKRGAARGYLYNIRLDRDAFNWYMQTGEMMPEK